MRNIAFIATTTLIAGLMALSGCAALLPVEPLVGDPLERVTAQLGQPTAVYPAGQERWLEFAKGPMGQYTWMAHMGADGRLRSYEQVLTSEKFATIEIGKARADAVLRIVGRPAERSRVALREGEVWSYRYKESGAWNSMMHIHFDPSGVVQMLQNGPDPMYEYNDSLRD